MELQIGVMISQLAVLNVLRSRFVKASLLNVLPVDSAAQNAISPVMQTVGSWLVTPQFNVKFIANVKIGYLKIHPKISLTLILSRIMK